MGSPSGSVAAPTKSTGAGTLGVKERSTLLVKGGTLDVELPGTTELVSVASITTGVLGGVPGGASSGGMVTCAVLVTLPPGAAVALT